MSWKILELPRSTPGIERPVAVFTGLCIMALIIWRAPVLLTHQQRLVLGTWYPSQVDPDSITFYVDGTAVEYRSQSESIQWYRYSFVDRRHLRLAG